MRYRTFKFVGHENIPTLALAIATDLICRCTYIVYSAREVLRYVPRGCPVTPGVVPGGGPSTLQRVAQSTGDLMWNAGVSRNIKRRLSATNLENSSSAVNNR